MRRGRKEDSIQTERGTEERREKRESVDENEVE
jgi:hypothetical protein